MLFDATLPPVPLNEVGAIAEAAEDVGFDALWSPETIHDPFLPGVLIAEHTNKLSFGTAVAIAFARSPANLAYTAWDLSQASNGRFILGLGTQVKAHIERRFGIEWPKSVVGKLREQIGAIRAFWKAWQNGEKLDFKGEYYSLNLMSPFFNPGPIKHPRIPIYIAGVNKGLANLAGETADGFLVHPLHTPSYLHEVLIPAIEKGLGKAGRSREDVKISTTAFVVTSPEEDLFVRAQISFYASAPSYRSVMKLHGWEDVAKALSRLAAGGKWGEMPGLVNDDMLNEFAIVSDPKNLASGLINRYQELVDRLGLYIPFVPGEKDQFWRDLIEGFREKVES